MPSHSRQYNEHEQCTFDLCEQSRIDSTSVAQRHEDCDGKCGKYNFPLRLLDERIEKSKFTAWRLVSDSLDDTPPLLDSKNPYMALSHVWADGTGGGISGPGVVNKCLFNFFCGIARDFQCEGLWWDTISIPTDEDLRRKALNVMHTNYAVARITLVHDLYLREWEWVNAEMACFAIVKSPWFSRGWTALELAKSHKVKILFKSRKNEGQVIKDLDIDILDEVLPSSPHYNLAMAINKLRRTSIQSFGDMLAILGPRDTSKPRDVPIISGLLAGIETSGGISHQEIYQRILRKLGKVAQGHLFHNLSTMTTPGFSWCPINILDMPMADTDSESTLLDLRENGDLEGTWKVYPVDDINVNDLLLQKVHPLTVISLKIALNAENKAKHVLLVENIENGLLGHRALLVRPMECEKPTTGAIHCRFVGPVYFHLAKRNRAQGDNGRPMAVIITNADKMKLPGQNAWNYVCGTVDGPEVNSKLEITNENLAKEFDAAIPDMEGLLFLANNKDDLRKEVSSDKYRIKIPRLIRVRPNRSAFSGDIVMSYVFHSEPGIEAFFYGSEELLNHVKESRNVQSGKLMAVFLDGNSNLQIDSNQSSERKAQLGTTALPIAVEMAENCGPLVTLLLDNGAQHMENIHKQLPIHLSAMKRDLSAFIILLANETSPANPNKTDANMQTALHVLVRHYFCFGQATPFIQTLQKVVEKMDQDGLDARDNCGKTALIRAVKNDNIEVVQYLLSAGVSVDIQDEDGCTALIAAALIDDIKIVQCLLGAGVSINIQDKIGATALLWQSCSVILR